MDGTLALGTTGKPLGFPKVLIMLPTKSFLSLSLTPVGTVHPK